MPRHAAAAGLNGAPNPPAALQDPSRPPANPLPMKKTLVSIAAVLALVAGPAARAGVQTDVAGPGPHFASENVEWITNIPLAIDSAGSNCGR